MSGGRGTVLIGFIAHNEKPIALGSVQVDDQMVEDAARQIATEFGYAWAFEEEMTEEMYDADYWRHVARQGLTAALDGRAL